jgi:hypothetical protein
LDGPTPTLRDGHGRAASSPSADLPYGRLEKEGRLEDATGFHFRHVAELHVG